MSLPSGNQTLHGRQRPWATFVILALCAATFVPAQLGFRQRVNRAAASLAQALAFHQQHPYLTLDPRLAGLDAGAVAAPGGKKAARGKFVALEQVELDGLTRAGFDALASTPAGRWGVVPGRLSPAALFLHGFVSWSFLPLLLNLAFLWAAGPLLEEEWSPLFFAGLCLAAALAGGAAFALGNRNLWLPFTGPGASVAALVGAFAVVRGSGRIRLPYWLGSARWGWVEAPAWTLVGLWLLRELLVPLLPEVPGPAPTAASLWAHGGGLVFGALTAAVLRWGPTRARGSSAADRTGRPAPAAAAPRMKPGPGAIPALAVGRGPAETTRRRSEAADPGPAPAGAEAARRRPSGGELSRGDVQAASPKRQEGRAAAPEAQVSPALEDRLAEELALGGRPEKAPELAPEAAPSELLEVAGPATADDRACLADQVGLNPGLPPEQVAEMEDLEPGPAAAPSPRTRPQASRLVQATEAVPRALSGGILTVEARGGPEKALALGRVRALASAAVDDAAMPNFLLDLLLDGPEPVAGPIRVLRFQSHQFDPRDLVPGAAEEEEAVLALAGAVAEASGATWLLGGAAERLRRYPSLAAYEKALRAALGL